MQSGIDATLKDVTRDVDVSHERGFEAKLKARNLGAPGCTKSSAPTELIHN